MKQAVCVVLEYNDLFLAVTRRNSKLLGLVGGKVDANETPVEAIIRETYEEVGIKLESSLLTAVYSDVCKGDVDYFTTTFTYPKLDQLQVSNLVIEDGLSCEFVTSSMLCDSSVSPFAIYNSWLFTEYKKHSKYN